MAIPSIPLDPVPLPIFAGRSTQDNPKVAWNGANWLVASETYDLGGTGYYYQKSLAAVRVSPAGHVLDAQPIKLPGLMPSGATNWALASDGENWVLVNQGTSASGGIVAVRISPGGVVTDSPPRSVVSAADAGTNLQLAHANGVFLLTFGAYDTKAVRFDRSLNILDTGVILLLGAPLRALAASSSGFYATWHRQEPDYSVRVVGSRVSTAGVKLDGNGVNFSGTRQPYAYAATSVAWDGVYWHVTWSDYSTTYAARVDGTGAVLDPGSVAVPGATSGPTTGTGDGRIQMVWSVPANSNYEILSARISPNHVATGSRVLSTGAPRQLRPGIATNGAGYLVGYQSATSRSNWMQDFPETDPDFLPSRGTARCTWLPGPRRAGSLRSGCPQPARWWMARRST